MGCNLPLAEHSVPSSSPAADWLTPPSPAAPPAAASPAPAAARPPAVVLLACFKTCTFGSSFTGCCTAEHKAFWECYTGRRVRAERGSVSEPCGRQRQRQRQRSCSWRGLSSGAARRPNPLLLCGRRAPTRPRSPPGLTTSSPGPRHSSRRAALPRRTCSRPRSRQQTPPGATGLLLWLKQHGDPGDPWRSQLASRPDRSD